MAKQIKTIVWGIGYTEGFDEEVNKALEEGWTLVRRDVRESILYAELEKSDDPQEEPSSGERRVCCETCKYANVFLDVHPCCDCYNHGSWEPKE